MVEPIKIDGRLSDLEISARNERLSKRGGNSGDVPPPSGIESRVARLEASVSHIESDIRDIKIDIKDLRVDIKDLRKVDESNFRILFSAIIATALGLAGLMAKGFGWL
ncbi:hypothetical protein [Nitrosomonas sp. Nm166]|uniref:hypothetical protein n=1 Tax=Nitrosomonas sp. Nm166 TaxID=1881054 RepID=UPI0008E3B002|nr:hypothetical protein [Nitrosomonas sp. Nm166]SFF26422.1 hypothetical protein SAMN05428977_10933 [Nitrosomonas sp. Nm166]